MNQEERHFETEMAVVGTGIAGVAASIFALNRGLHVSLTGNTGSLAYTTGYLDLMGSFEKKNFSHVTDPWQAVSELATEDPEHPLAGIDAEDIKKAFTDFVSFISDCGIAYTHPGEQNLTAMSPVGTVKKTLCVPKTMMAGVTAYAEKSRCLIVDFKGLRGFSGAQIVANMGPDWPGLRHERIEVPDMQHKEIYPEVLARTLEVPKNRETFAEAVKQVAGDAEVIGMPAVFGMYDPDKTMAALEQLIGIPLFEIPTMPPSVPGIRLREMVEQYFPQKGVTLIPQQKVTSIEFTGDAAVLHTADNYGPIRITAKSVVLATGRFISGGLEANVDEIKEPLLDLPVTQPETRDQWYQRQYMGKTGHEVHKAGIEVDDSFRPLDRNGKPVHARLFAAGILLAHQDWIRSRSGAGIAIATAYKAVESAAALLGK